MNSSTISPEILKQQLSQFTGTEVWYRHPLNRRMLYTEGVQHFAEAAGCYWLLDIIATEIFRLQVTMPFLHIRLIVEGGEGDIVADDGNGVEAFRRHINFTDAPDGEWRFYLTDNVVLLPGEY